jgi:predicted enzyme related to lactoylglutathione lyase
VVHRIQNLGRDGLDGTFVERGEHIPDYVCIYVEVDDLALVLRSVSKSGGSVIRPPYSPDGQSTVCIVEDPEGHLITVRQTARSAEPTR